MASPEFKFLSVSELITGPTLSEREAQAEGSNLKHREQTVDIQRDTQRLVAIGELQLPSEDGVELWPLNAFLRIWVEVVDEPDEVLSHVTGAVRVEQIATMTLMLI